MIKKVALLLILFICITLSLILVSTKINNGYIEKDKITDSFKRNKERFVVVQKYADSIKGNLYIDIRDPDFNKNHYIKEIVYIIDKLNYIGIYEDENSNTLKFVFESGENEQGIMYIKSNINPNINPSIGSCERIIDNWFYYSEIHT